MHPLKTQNKEEGVTRERRTMTLSLFPDLVAHASLIKPYLFFQDIYF